MKIAKRIILKKSIALFVPSAPPKILLKQGGDLEQKNGDKILIKNG